jgi:hypothetical protein
LWQPDRKVRFILERRMSRRVDGLAAGGQGSRKITDTKLNVPALLQRTAATCYA